MADHFSSEALREALLRQLLGEIPVIFWSTDEELRFTSFFGAGLQMLGAKPNRVVGQSLSEVLGTMDAGHPAIAAHRRALTGVSGCFETAWGGHVLCGHVSPLSGPEGRVIGCAGVAHDITDQRRTQEALQRARDELNIRVRERTAELASANARLRAEIDERRQAEETLRRAERLASIGTLAAGIAHEINNPLGAIVIQADMALQWHDRPDRVEVTEAALQAIQTEAVRCGRIVKDVLQFARQEVSQKWPGDLGKVARQARDLTRKEAAARGVTVSLQLKDGLPPVVMNPTEMVQVFVNLITNAVQASPSGGEVKVHLWAEGERLAACVEDQGHGMSGEQLRRIFDPFYTTRREEGGTGLGLSITYGIMQQHGGTIDVQSILGRGTTVNVRLPLRPSSLQGAEHGEDPHRR